MESKLFLNRELLEKLAEPARYDASKLAAGCNLSVRQLQRIFQNSLGCTPQKWLNDLRIFRAQERLLLGASVKQTAFDMGYRDVSYFCHQFKRLCGVTPSEFRDAKMGARK
jgi:AraC family transcriptional regulator of arabinose operon